MIDDLLRDREVVAALDAVGGHDDREDAVARVAWTVLAEPGDGVAGALIAELGAAESLRFVVADAAGLLTPRRAPHVVEEGIARWRPRAEIRGVREAILGARDAGAHLVLPGDETWPTPVDDLREHAPALLWVRGDPRMLVREPSVAIVGARAASAYGEMLAAEFAGDLAASGAVIVSGGAYGIDGSAHRAALSVDGATVAFLAGGVDRAYPQGHRQLLERIVERGAVVSEVPCGTAPTKWRFLSRNRLIAAVSRATVVVEAGWRSGSLNTAGHASALGRALGAVPGPVTSAASAGCHRLLREYDARCVTTTAEIRELWEIDSHPSTSPAMRDPDLVRLLDALSSRSALPVAELCRRSGLAPERIGALLGMAELDGIVARAEGGWRRSAVRTTRGGG